MKYHIQHLKIILLKGILPVSLFNRNKIKDHPFVSRVFIMPCLSNLPDAPPLSYLLSSPIGIPNIKEIKSLSEDSYHDFCLAHLGLFVHNAVHAGGFVNRKRFSADLNTAEDSLKALSDNPWLKAILLLDPEEPSPSLEQVLSEAGPIDKMALQLTRDSFVNQTQEVAKRLTQSFVDQRNSTNSWFESQLS